jgi:predicted anti-sigma-YlaC factor YlaD
MLIMAAETECQFDDELFEQYSMGTISSEDLERIEEHLLICETCRQRVAECDIFIEAMRRAAVRERLPRAEQED